MPLTFPSGVVYLNLRQPCPRASSASRQPVMRRSHRMAATLEHPTRRTGSAIEATESSQRAPFARLIAGARAVRGAGCLPVRIRHRGAAARNLPSAGGLENIVVIDQEYPSNYYYSWRRLADANGAEIRSVRPAGKREPPPKRSSPAIDRRHRRGRRRALPLTDGCLVDRAARRGGGPAARRGVGR